MTFLTDPVGWWIEPFTSNPFMTKALAAGLLAMLTTSVVGTWVVLRGMSFLGDALAHGVLPGIALAFILGFDTGLGALLAAIVMTSTISFIPRISPLSEDTSTGVLFVGFLALAVVIMSSGAAAGAGDLDRFLFGSITGVQNAELARQAVIAAVSVGVAVIFYRAFFVMTFCEVQAQMARMRPRLTHGVLMALLAISIVGSFQAVGSLLVFAFLIAPAATASMFVRRVPLMMAAAVLIGTVSVYVGLLMSYHHRLAGGASMALTAVVILFGAILIRALVLSLRPAPPEDQLPVQMLADSR